MALENERVTRSAVRPYSIGVGANTVSTLPVGVADPDLVAVEDPPEPSGPLRAGLVWAARIRGRAR